MENDVAIELEAMLEKAQPLFTTESCCIYKVPHQFRQSNEDAYTPVLVSIGPLHHGNSRLVTMEGHKQVYCQHFIQRSEASLTDLMSCVQQLEPQIRACYSEKIDLTVDELVKVIFIDCCFVIELFLGDEWVINDVIPSKSWMAYRVMQDLILLENQVPFFVFEKIYNLAFASRLNGAEFPSFMRLAFGIFKIHNHQGVSPPSNGRTIAHFTDLLRYLYLPPSHRIPSRNPGSLVLGHSASKLVEAGVKFSVNKPWHGIGILDLEFEHGILKIPHIEVDDFTEVRLRNIVALEQCHYPDDHYITDYVSFLAGLVNRDKDKDVLINAGIIESIVSGNDTSVAKLFSDVDKNTIVSNVNDSYLKICDDLKAYYKHPCHTKMATLRRDYFTTPWKTAASIAGIVLLLLTFVQTICSILQV
ncbi:UPF0481 protein At3g47200-like [Arachis ipaensis]|nr:UPF0481 protein At3g47200-like [Arachis ipaensis]XP_020962641.1 UPF0481 protein At3g47200-like [Arachis ipaensis]XP_020962642.1 UPF0481 protein At3g47200-like [Arachis ipaensis]XP_020962643.1 UPF0481 protein At3g47200-like [Arachis ipaensis]XP_025667394.1 UPF0481 protein At3g47200 [Arachis hypogaea]